MYFVLEGHQATFPERCFLVGTFSERYPWWPSLVYRNPISKSVNTITQKFRLVTCFSLSSNARARRERAK